MNALIFNGFWPPWVCFLLAFAAASATYFLYRRETQQCSHSAAKPLPWLRASSVAMLVLMLAGPTLRQTRNIGSPTKLSVFIDNSQSMGTTDGEMETVRKLAIARGLRWLAPPAESSDAEKIAESLAAACRIVRASLNAPPLNDDTLREASTSFLSQLAAARQRAEGGAFSSAELKDIDRTLIAPLKQFASRKQRATAPVAGPPKELLSLIDSADRWQQAATQKATDTAVALAGGDRKVAAALERLDETSRQERVRALLLDGGRESFLTNLSKNFEVELLCLTNDTSRVMWRSSETRDASSCVFPNPDSTSTNIGSAVLDRLLSTSGASQKPSASPDSRPHSAAVLLTDGRHNAQGSPFEAAKRLGDAGIPLYCIGIGSNVRPVDLAVSDVEAPNTVFFEDRVSGWIIIKDDMTPGMPFQAEITSAGRVLWKKDMTTSQQGSRRIPFDFQIKELVASSLEGSKARHSVVPLTLKASVTVLPQEREIRNNTSDFLVRATTGKRRMLLMDGRPRWEMRYIRNLYERDPQWTVNSLIIDSDPYRPVPRGTVPGSFPADEALLNEYDMVILGDLPSSALSDSELTWLYNYVTKRGGGLLLLDGQRHALSGYSNTPIAPLIPVAFPSGTPLPPEPAADALLLTDSGRRATALKLDPDAQNVDDTWSTLPPPRRITRATPLPGSDVLLEAQISTERTPALVTRRQGAGNVAFLAFDETWRWRSGVAGKFQERFWSQLVNSIADPAFSSSDDRISLDTDAFRYAPGATAVIRARYKGAGQRDTLKGSIWRDGSKVGSVDLLADPARHDVFQGQTAPLEVGVYDFGLDDAGDEPGYGLKLRFEVQPEQKGELSELTLDEALLSQMSEASRGRYLREENAGELLDLLQPLKTGQIVTSETQLAHGYPWFAVVISLLSLEWMLRKRAGLV